MLAKIKNLLSPTTAAIKKNVPALFASTLADIKEEKIKVGPNNINYVKVGNGTHHMLCIPGGLGTIWTDFKPQVEGFNREKFTVVAWDPPGHGKSRPPKKDFRSNFYEKDAEDAFRLMQALNIPKYSVLGWSAGSLAAMIHAAKYQNAMKKLVISAGFSFIAPKDVPIYEKMRNMEQWPSKINDALIGVYGKELYTKYYTEWIDGMIDKYVKNNGNLCSDLLEDIKCPTLILHGEKDPLVNKDHALHLHTHIKGSKIHLYSEGKHNIQFKYADDFNRRVQDFLLSS